MIHFVIFYGGLLLLTAPPPGTDPNSSTSKWFRSLEVPGDSFPSSCCGEADCRPVKSQRGTEGWEAFIDVKTFGPSAPDKYIAVPSGSIVQRDDNPLSSAVACWNKGFPSRIICFILPPST